MFLKLLFLILSVHQALSYFGYANQNSNEDNNQVDNRNDNQDYIAECPFNFRRIGNKCYFFEISKTVSFFR